MNLNSVIKYLKRDKNKYSKNDLLKHLPTIF